MNCGNWERPRKVENWQPRGLLVGHIIGEVPMVEDPGPEVKGPAIKVNEPMIITHLLGKGARRGRRAR